jgi:hypothetical protein
MTALNNKEIEGRALSVSIAREKQAGSGGNFSRGGGGSKRW